MIKEKGSFGATKRGNRGRNIQLDLRIRTHKRDRRKQDAKEMETEKLNLAGTTGSFALFRCKNHAKANVFELVWVKIRLKLKVLTSRVSLLSMASRRIVILPTGVLS